AQSAYRADKLPAAEAWLHLYRWAQLFGQDERAFVLQWIAEVRAASLAHPNMPQNYNPVARPLGEILTPELRARLMGDAAFSGEFFGLLAPVDYLPRVFEILNELHRRDPARFLSHRSLAVAIALVYDVPPPPIWPHAQVSATSLPRRFAPPEDAFEWWIDQEKKGRLFHRTAALGADELKFVVDTVTPFVELTWSQQVADYPLGQLAKAYTMVRYRADRAANSTAVWTGASYRMHEVLGQGGICVDQAYFAAQVGKARGVPTLLFQGRGNDGRHAWFGYLDSNRQWKLDAGRYKEQRFVTGYARDPQTWRELSDHELRFLSERFHELPSFKASQVHASFAADFLAQREAPAAAQAARRAVTLEKRNRLAWDTLLAAAQSEGKPPTVIEGVLREAAAAFARYPDLEAAYLTRAAESLRARGQGTEADAELRKLALKNRSGRGDLSVQQARDQLLRAVATKPLPEQVQTYNSVVDSYGRGAGMSFYDGVIVGFVEHLLAEGQKAEAQRAIERAKRVLKIEDRSQLAEEMAALAKKAK
ncbi:MAG TPA: hypothetical protein VGE76_15480, partial [Opitutaceae bacterium]